LLGLASVPDGVGLADESVDIDESKNSSFEVVDSLNYCRVGEEKHDDTAVCHPVPHSAAAAADCSHHRGQVADDVADKGQRKVIVKIKTTRVVGSQSEVLSNWEEKQRAHPMMDRTVLNTPEG